MWRQRSNTGEGARPLPLENVFAVPCRFTLGINVDAVGLSINAPGA
jgi:hypothetical protein